MKLPPRLERYWEHFVSAGDTAGIDPALIAAVCDRESLGGDALTPPGPEGTGDGGHGRGLMQIDDRWHRDFISLQLEDGTYAWATPAQNIAYGASLIRDYRLRLGGNLLAAVCAYNAGVNAAKVAVGTLLQSATQDDTIAALDRHTTGRNYVADVFRRFGEFTSSSQP